MKSKEVEFKSKFIIEKIDTSVVDKHTGKVITHWNNPPITFDYTYKLENTEEEKILPIGSERSILTGKILKDIIGKIRYNGKLLDESEYIVEDNIIILKEAILKELRWGDNDNILDVEISKIIDIAKILNNKKNKSWKKNRFFE